MKLENNSSVKIFIIEDDQEELLILKEFFKTRNDIIVCGTALNGREGLDMISSCSPDIVITDLLMPWVDGIGILKNLRKVSGSFDMGIIVLSGVGNKNIIESAFEEGANYYLIKPVELEFLAERILAVFKSIRSPKALYGYSDPEFLIKETVKSVGVPINIVGYSYIIQALKIMISDKGKLLKEIYYNIAGNSSTSSACVDAGIHNAVKKCYFIKNKIYRCLFLERGVNGCPTNSVFLNTLRENIHYSRDRRL